MFVDDSLLLFKIDGHSGDHLQNILCLYERCSGQNIQKDKCSIMFSKNTSEGDRLAIMSSLEITYEAHNEKYLGLPVYMGKSKVQTFNYRKVRV